MAETDTLWPIGMPNLGHTMESGKVVAWNKQIGESVARGEILCVVESDKVSVEIESPADGTLLEIRVAADGVAAVGATIGVVGPAGAKPTAATPAAATTASAPASVPAPAAAMAAPSSPQRYVRRASPVAERLAAELGVDLSAVSGTGPDGLITKHDVSRASASKPAAAIVTTPAVPADLTRMIVDLDIELLSWRRRIDEVTIAMSAFAARALALALTVRPELRALRSGAYGLTAALSLGQRTNPHLVVVREIEHKTLAALGEELGQLERRARAGSLEPWRTAAAPIVIEDFAPYGIDVIAAVPAQAAGLTLALGRPRRVMAETRDGFGFRTTMAVSLTAPAQMLSPHATADLLEAVALNLADPDALYLPVRPPERPNRNPT